MSHLNSFLDCIISNEGYETVKFNVLQQKIKSYMRVSLLLYDNKFTQKQKRSASIQIKVYVKE